MADLTTKYLGLTLRNPIIVGSSGLSDSVEKILELERAGAGAVVLKSLFEEQILIETEANVRKAYENDMIYTAKSESLDYIDMHIKEDTVGQYIELIHEAKSKVVIPVIASINCVSSVEWTSFARQIEEAGADALEINIALFPSDMSIDNEKMEKIYFDIISKILQQVSIPVALKIGPYFTSLASMINRLSATGIKSIVLFNRFYSLDFDINTLTVESVNILSVPAESSNVLRWIAIMARKVSCELCATTGIHDGQGVIKQILAGATTVQIVSALYINGIGKLSDIVGELVSWMDEKGYNNIQQFRGMMSQDESENPSAFERIQFMKYFSEIR